jgi:hypothetical protein
VVEADHPRGKAEQLEQAVLEAVVLVVLVQPPLTEPQIRVVEAAVLLEVTMPVRVVPASSSFAT